LLLEYFLEDVVQLLNYEPILDKNLSKKRKLSKEQVNCNLLVSATYPDEVRKRVAMIDEDVQELKIIEVRYGFSN